MQDIVVGNYALTISDINNITSMYIEGCSTNEIADKLNVHPEELNDIITNDDLFDKILEHQKKIIKLAFYGPVVSNLIRLATDSGDKRTSLGATKILAKILEIDVNDKAGRPKKEDSVTTRGAYDMLTITNSNE